jgi:hypothetical protein
MVSLAERRRGAEHLEVDHGVSERRACQVIGIDRSSKRRPSGRIEEASGRSRSISTIKSARSRPAKSQETTSVVPR